MSVGFSLPSLPELPNPVAELPHGIRRKRHDAWQTAHGLLTKMRPTPTDVLALAVFLAALDEAEEDEETDAEEYEEDDEAPGFSAFELIDRFPPIQLLRRLFT